MPSGLDALSKVRVTEAIPEGLRLAEPLKITSIIAPPRRLLADCSPRTHLMASTILDLPQPLGPTIPTTGRVESDLGLVGERLKPRQGYLG